MALSPIAFVLFTVLLLTRAATNDNFKESMEDRDIEKRANICGTCAAGPNPPAGQCQSYDCGGTSGIHFYTCCSGSGTTHQGGSNTSYCGGAGQNTGGGCALGGPFGCGAGAGQTTCLNWCDTNAVSFPGMCWNWNDCFKRCCGVTAAGGNPNVGGVPGWIKITVFTKRCWGSRDESNSTVCEACASQSSEVWVPATCPRPYCGDGTCNDGECPSNCPADCPSTTSTSSTSGATSGYTSSSSSSSSSSPSSSSSSSSSSTSSTVSTASNSSSSSSTSYNATSSTTGASTSSSTSYNSTSGSSSSSTSGSSSSSSYSTGSRRSINITP